MYQGYRTCSLSLFNTVFTLKPILRSTNKETLVEKQKKYYEERKEIISEQRNEKILCDCGCSISKRNISSHKKTKKHLDLINLNSSENNGNL